MNRKLVPGDIVCARPAALGKLWSDLSRTVQPHERYQIQEAFISVNGRRVLQATNDSGHYLYAWPSEVWLADGTAERFQLRKEKYRKQIAADKAAKRAARKGGHAHATRSKE